jgi:hypothetical protein
MWSVDREIKNVIVYIDDLLEQLHTDTHEAHLEVLNKVLACLLKNLHKINLYKCFFRNKEVSNLGFTLMQEVEIPGKYKLKAIKDAKPPTDMKRILVSAISSVHTLSTLFLLSHNFIS